MISRRGPHKLSTSENIVCNEQDRMAEENIDKRVNILENKKVNTCTCKCKWKVIAGPGVWRSGY